MRTKTGISNVRQNATFYTDCIKQLRMGRAITVFKQEQVDEILDRLTLDEDVIELCRNSYGISIMLDMSFEEIYNLNKQKIYMYQQKKKGN